MDWLSAVSLGVLQGLTEFLPVSSTAHLSLLQYFWSLQDTPRFFDVMLHVGTLLAVVWYYRVSFREATRVMLGGTAPADSVFGLARPYGRAELVQLTLLVCLATVPTVATGVLFRPAKPAPESQTATLTWRQHIGNLREQSSQRPWLVTGCLVLTGGVLLAASQMRPGSVGPSLFTWRHALAIGLAQAFSATLPGLSRSGMTISTAMVLGVEPRFAVHFSLLMSIPAILGAAVLKTADVDPAWMTSANLTATLFGALTSAAVGWGCVVLLMGTVQRRRWWWFALYVWSLAAVVAAVLTLRG